MIHCLKTNKPYKGFLFWLYYERCNLSDHKVITVAMSPNEEILFSE